MSLFQDLDAVANLPAPISDAISIMLSEIEESGEHTTADETSLAIEAVFIYLGRLWVAEYLHLATRQSDALDDGLNRYLFEALGRKLLLGHWVGLSRRIHQHFVAGNLETTLPGLAQQDFGTPGDMDHPVAKLVSFRNAFSHGSFSAVVDEIRTHRQLLETLLEGLPALTEHCPVFNNPESGEAVRCSGRWTRLPLLTDEQALPLQPVCPLPDGGVLALYPLFSGAFDATGYALKSGKPAQTVQAFQHSVLKLWLERYEHERAGHLDHSERFNPSPLATSVQSALAEHLAANDAGLILVETHPGCAPSQAIAALAHNDTALSLQTYDAVAILRVEPGDLGHSGYTVARVVLRKIEALLGLDDGHFKDPMPTILKTLDTACEALRASSKRLLLGLEGLHRGQTPYRGEPISVLDVYTALAGSGVTVVATCWPGSIQGTLLFDQRIQTPIPTSVDVDELRQAVSTLCSGQPLRLRILKALSKADGPHHLFSLCDTLEADGPSVFEPAVERALWDLRPVLTGARQEQEVEGTVERVRVWSVFSPSISDGLKGVQT